MVSESFNSHKFKFFLISANLLKQFYSFSFSAVLFALPFLLDSEKVV